MPILHLIACGAFATASPKSSSFLSPLRLGIFRPSAHTSTIGARRSRPVRSLRTIEHRPHSTSAKRASLLHRSVRLNGSSRLLFGICDVHGFQFLSEDRVLAAMTTTTAVTTTRLFGTKRGTPGAPPGEIAIVDNFDAPLPSGSFLSLSELEATLEDIRSILGYITYDLTLVLTDDEEMRETNAETRGVDAPTDILSFQFHECVVDEEGIPVPGELKDPEFDFPDHYNLGDLMVDVPYVLRRIEEDRAKNEGREAVEEDPAMGEDVGDDGESDIIEDDDRGVSGAMSTEYDPQRRIEMLLVHGMLHLVGYDHIEDEDYEIMVAKEEEVLKELEERRMKRKG